MSSLPPQTPTPEMIERIAALIPSDENINWAERGRLLARSMLLLQANRLEEIAATDDLALYRQAKEDDDAYTAFRQYFQEHLPTMVTDTMNGGHSEAMQAFLHGDVCERRDMLYGTALLLKRLAEQPMDSATLDSAVNCMKLLPLSVR